FSSCRSGLTPGLSRAICGWRSYARGLVAGEASHLRVAGTVHEHRHACSQRCGGQQVRVIIEIPYTLTQEKGRVRGQRIYAFFRCTASQDLIGDAEAEQEHALRFLAGVERLGRVAEGQ